MKEWMIHPKRLFYFGEVFKRGSINAAADHLNMVQVGIGRQIQLLEQELGVRLFERGKRGRGMVPTEVAQILYDHYGRYCDWQEKMAAAVPREPTEKAAKEPVINARRLFYFSEVFKWGSINAVADRLNRVQAGIGRQIQLLEEELGVRLFERGTNGQGMVTGGQGRGMVPTEAAGILYDYYRKYRDWQDKMEAAIEEWRSMKLGAIYIAASCMYIDTLMEEILNDFCAEHPHLNVYIEEINSSSQIMTAILNDSIHIGITRSAPTDHDICCLAHTSLPVKYVVNRGHPLTNRRIVTVQEIAQYPFALSSTSSPQQWIRTMEQTKRVHLAPAFVSSSVSALKKFSLTGRGAMLMSDLTACKEIEANQLIALEIDHPVCTSAESYLIVRRSKPLSPAANQLLRLLAARLPFFAGTAHSIHRKEKGAQL